MKHAKMYSIVLTIVSTLILGYTLDITPASAGVFPTYNCVVELPLHSPVCHPQDTPIVVNGRSQCLRPAGSACYCPREDWRDSFYGQCRSGVCQCQPDKFCCDENNGGCYRATDAQACPGALNKPTYPATPDGFGMCTNYCVQQFKEATSCEVQCPKNTCPVGTACYTNTKTPGHKCVATDAESPADFFTLCTEAEDLDTVCSAQCSSMRCKKDETCVIQKMTRDPSCMKKSDYLYLGSLAKQKKESFIYASCEAVSCSWCEGVKCDPIKISNTYYDRNCALNAAGDNLVCASQFDDETPCETCSKCQSDCDKEFGGDANTPPDNCAKYECKSNCSLCSVETQVYWQEQYDKFNCGGGTTSGGSTGGGSTGGGSTGGGSTGGSTGYSCINKKCVAGGNQYPNIAVCQTACGAGTTGGTGGGQQQYHAECINGYCTKVPGPGPNACNLGQLCKSATKGFAPVQQNSISSQQQTGSDTCTDSCVQKFTSTQNQTLSEFFLGAVRNECSKRCSAYDNTLKSGNLPPVIQQQTASSAEYQSIPVIRPEPENIQRPSTRPPEETPGTCLNQCEAAAAGKGSPTAIKYYCQNRCANGGVFGPAPQQQSSSTKPLNTNEPFGPVPTPPAPETDPFIRVPQPPLPPPIQRSSATSTTSVFYGSDCSFDPCRNIPVYDPNGTKCTAAVEYVSCDAPNCNVGPCTNPAPPPPSTYPQQQSQTSAQPTYQQYNQQQPQQNAGCYEECAQALRGRGTDPQVIAYYCEKRCAGENNNQCNSQNCPQGQEQCEPCVNGKQVCTVVNGCINGQCSRRSESRSCGNNGGNGGGGGNQCNPQECSGEACSPCDNNGMQTCLMRGCTQNGTCGVVREWTKKCGEPTPSCTPLNCRGESCGPCENGAQLCRMQGCKEDDTCGVVREWKQQCANTSIVAPPASTGSAGCTDQRDLTANAGNPAICQACLKFACTIGVGNDTIARRACALTCK